MGLVEGKIDLPQFISVSDVVVYFASHFCAVAEWLIFHPYRATLSSAPDFMSSKRNLRYWRNSLCTVHPLYTFTVKLFLAKAFVKKRYI